MKSLIKKLENYQINNLILNFNEKNQKKQKEIRDKNAKSYSI